MKIPYLPSSSLSFPSGPITKALVLLVSLSVGQWVFSEFVHIPGGSIGIIALLSGIWLFSKPLTGKFDAPQTVQSWIRRCEQVLKQFDDLEDESDAKFKYKERTRALNEIIEKEGPQSIAFVSSSGVELPEKSLVQEAIAGPNPLNLAWSTSLPLKDDGWIWPKTLFEQDLLVYVIPLPLRASDLLWLEQVPDDQCSWLMVSSSESLANWPEQLKALQAQLPHRWTNQILRWNKTQKELSKLLNPIRRVLEQPQRNLDKTRMRLLSRLHSSWQSDLENLRRMKFRVVQQRTQWVVAGAVFASPVPSTDLLALSVANGLMIKEMAQIWSCSWKAETLQIISKQLAVAAVAQGVVEWTGHALFSVAKLHGTSWLAAGTMQALSAAYLTRVVGRSMADWMALNNGVSEPDLEALKKQAPLLIAKAAEQERTDWSGFLKQASSWLKEQDEDLKINHTYLEAL